MQLTLAKIRMTFHACNLRSSAKRIAIINAAIRLATVAAMIAGLVVNAEPAIAQTLPDQLERGKIREAHYDLCLPATAEEYEAMGKHAVLMIVAKSVISTELPIKSAYLEVKDIRIPLQKFSRSEIREHREPNSGNEYAEQVYFYLVPISLIKREARLVIDFSGQRSGFGLGTFGPETLSGAPAFIKLDEYDTGSDANMEAVAGLLAREYPAYFGSN